MKDTDKYIAINIGPVVKTLSLARKPRELWAASYLFSYLMECILSEANKPNYPVEVISPVEWKKDEELNVGIYPDRIYMKLRDKAQPQIADKILSEAWETFRDNVYCRECEGKEANDFEHEESQFSEKVRGEWLYKAYFNLMHTSCSAINEVEAVKQLNHQLDVLELCVMASNKYEYDDNGDIRFIDPQEQIIKLIKRRNRSSLFAISSGKARFPVDSLAEIAAVELETVELKKKWEKFVDIVRKDDDTINPYSLFGDKQKSYHRYFCVVQADGDNMGKTFTDPNLGNGKIKEISKALNDFGKSASKKITDFGGLPIYAGGDDLLFLAPVVGCKGKDIFQLLEELNSVSFKVVRDACNDALNGQNVILPTLSFGVSISYYKYPLYEALETAMNLLFEVAKKKGTVKHKVAWELKKHSGETFAACYSKEDKGLDDAFRTLIEETADGKTVSAVAHKSKETWKLLENCLEIYKANGTRSRVDAYFRNILDEPKDSPYYKAVKELLINLCVATDITGYSDVFYAMLRTAKFIKGEDVKDE